MVDGQGDDLDTFIAEQIAADPDFARRLLIEAMAAEMHRDSDHGKDGSILGEWLCNCREKATSAARALVQIDRTCWDDGTGGHWHVQH